jgi:hypothetical protein
MYFLKTTKGAAIFLPYLSMVDVTRLVSVSIGAESWSMHTMVTIPDANQSRR